MNNSQLNHFARTPIDLDISRSKFSRPKRKLTTFDAGMLIPLMCEEVLPGDSVKVKLSTLIRMATPIHPTMDNLYADVHFYYIPMRQVFNRTKEFFGENTATYWASNVTYTIPQITHPLHGGDAVSDSDQVGFAVGTIGDYLEYPVKRKFELSVLPIRAYCHVWNNFYRDQNTMQPCNISLGDSATSGQNNGVQSDSDHTQRQAYINYVKNGTYVLKAERGAAPLPVCKFHDYFTSALIGPQKSLNPVLLPLGQAAPIKNSTTASPFSPVWYSKSGTSYVSWDDQDDTRALLTTGHEDFPGTNADINYSPAMSLDPAQAFVKLEADLSNATAASINSLRNAFMLQRYYERLARSGSRYFEMIYAFFGVRVPDLTVQIPEFLGGRRIPINITQVAQTSSTDSAAAETTTPQGNLSAYSLTTDSDEVFTKSFTEHGFLLAVGCVRAEHSYSQGCPRQLMRKTFTDYYLPTFANAPEQPIYKKELFAGTDNDDDVFGYQEAWAEYRYSPSAITGEFRPDFAQSLKSYHYGDDYDDVPSLSAGWIAEPQNLIDRTLAVTSHHQFLADFLFDMEWVRPMPVYSIPGLLDHH